MADGGGYWARVICKPWSAGGRLRESQQVLRCINICPGDLGKRLIKHAGSDTATHVYQHVEPEIHLIKSFLIFPFASQHYD